MACSQDHCRESAVVTKNFTVLKREEHSTDVSDCEVVSAKHYIVLFIFGVVKCRRQI